MPNSATNSVDSTANSGKKDLFTCTICKRGFSSGQALGGHQNAHRYENKQFMRRVADVIRTHGSNPYVAAALAEVQPTAAAAYQVPPEVNVARWGCHGIVHPTVNLLAASSGGAYYFHEVYFAMIRSEVDNQLKEDPQGFINVTRDYLAEWENNDTTNWNGAAAGSVRSSERTVTEPIFRVGGDGEEMTSEQRDDDLDLELKL